MNKPNIIQFICYSPRIYSGFDNFQVSLSRELYEKSYHNIVAYSDTINIPKLEKDISDNNGIIEIISTKNNITIIRDILKIIIKYKPKIVHTHFDNRIHLIVALLSLLFRIDFYFSFWSEITTFSPKEYIREKGIAKYLLLRSYFRVLVLTSKRAFMGSKAIHNQFLTFYSEDLSKIQTFYLGTEIYINNKDRNLLRTNYKVPKDFMVISNISAIEYIKGIHVLIEALGLLKEKYDITNFVCYHIGTIRSVTKESVWFYESLIELIKSKNLQLNFVWLEFLDNVTDILKISDIYVHPSLQEGLGTANLEAATQSLPIIGSNVGGIPEIVHHNKNGYLFSAESAEELANYLNLLMIDKDLRLKMGDESLKIIKNNFNMDSQITLLTQFYLF